MIKLLKPLNLKGGLVPEGTNLFLGETVESVLVKSGAAEYVNITKNIESVENTNSQALANLSKKPEDPEKEDPENGSCEKEGFN